MLFLITNVDMIDPSHTHGSLMATQRWRSTQPGGTARRTLSWRIVSPHIVCLSAGLLLHANVMACAGAFTFAHAPVSCGSCSDMKLRVAAPLEVLAPPDGDWLRVRTRDGLEGWVKRKNVYYREGAGGGGRGGRVAHSAHAHVQPMAVDGEVEPEPEPAPPVVPPRVDPPY